MSSSFATPRHPALGLASGLRAVAIAGVLAVALTLTFGAASAQAAKGIVGVVGQFTDQNGSGEGEFSTTAGVAVNQDTGDVYVVDGGNDRVQRFDADGAFISQWGGCGQAGGEFALGCGNELIAGIAVDETDGSVYVADTGNQRVQKFTADGTFVLAFGLGVDIAGDPDVPTFEICTVAAECQSGFAGSGDGELSAPVAVALAPNGDVLVADYNNARVQRFDSTGTYLSQFSTGFSPHRVAVDSTAIYVLEYSSQVQKFDADGNLIEVLGEGQVSAPEDIASDGSHVFVASAQVGPTPVVFELDPALAAGEQLVETHTLQTAAGAVTGLAAHAASGRLYIALRLENSAGAQFYRVYIVDDGGIPPATVTLLPASNVETTSATLNALINSNGGLPTDYRLEISSDGIDWRTVDSGSIAGGFTDEPIAANIDGLRPNTLYRFRIVTNKGFESGEVTSPEQDFLTDPAPPTILDTRAGTVDTASAVLLGSINPNSSETRYRFDFGIGAFTRSIPIPEAPIGSGPDPVFVSQTLQGLAPDTTYQFRLVATNSTGPATSPTRTFTTASVSREGRGYELVSPAYKPSGVGAGIWYAGPAASATVGTGAYDKERFAVQGSLGSVIIDGPIAYGIDWAFAERTSGGWVSQPGLSRRAHGSQLLTQPPLQESTEDLSLTAFGSNGHYLRFFPEMEDWDEAGGQTALLVRDWTSDWELVAPTDFSQVHLSDGAVSAGSVSKAFAEDGSAIVASSRSLRGLAGPGDPTNFGDRLGEGTDNGVGSVYLDEIVRPFSGIFPGDDGVRELVDVCTGDGPTRTILPITGPCPAPEAGRDARLISPGGAGLTIERSVTPSPRVISADGSRVFFMSPDPAPNGSVPQVYVRQRNSDDSCALPPCVVTRWISRPVPGAPDVQPQAAYFESASRDGDKVLFRTTTPLTAEDPNGAVSGAVSSDLYMYDLPPGDDPAGGQLTRITAGPDGDSDCNSPEDSRNHGGVRFTSDDASRVYFVCAGPLNGAIASAGGSITSPGGTPASSDASNLYLYDANRPAQQRWRFIARLPRGGLLQSCATIATGNDSVLVAAAAAIGTSFSQKGNCFSGSRDGSLVTFFTDARLTADDPDTVTGDIYGYDATRDELVRVTAPQGGPGGPYDCAPGDPDSPQCHGDGGISNQDNRSLKRLGIAVRPDGTRLAFFESRSRLVPDDVDDAYDVYQWSEGELSLLSTGQSDTDGAFYVGNDRAGLNVYIATRDQLTWQDTDAVMDVYTTRIGGGIPQPPTPATCAVLADACQAPASGAPIATVDTSTKSVRAGDGDAVSPPRGKISLKALTARQRASLARGRRTVLTTKVNLPGRVSIKGHARLRGNKATVLSASKAASKAGTIRIGIRLTQPARHQLTKTHKLTIRLTAKFSRTPEPVSHTTTLTRPKTTPKR